MTKEKYPANVIIHWLSNKDTALYVGLWEELNNDNFNLTEYREIRINEIGTSSYTMSPKQWKAMGNSRRIPKTRIWEEDRKRKKLNRYWSMVS